MSNLTSHELKLNEMIDGMKTDIITPQRDKDLKEVLQYVSTISQDGGIEKLLTSIQRKFPEYGS